MKHIPLACLLVANAFASRAQETPKAGAAPTLPPGHSVHGEAFNEGPRQRAVLMEGMGEVHFPVTTRHDQAQQFFNQGVGQIHGFWYFEAERSFRQVAALDADCAMAYWGMAMANIKNPKRAADFVKEAEKRKSKASPREQLWISAWASYYSETKKDENVRRGALIKALEDLVFEYPDDLEAKAFLVFQLWDNKQHGVPLPSRLAVDALARQVLDRQPMHGGAHHYLIHLWNRNEGDKRAIASAARCGQSAPGIAHMWHMSGHTFSELKRYADAVWQQEAAARVDHAYMLRARILPEQIHNFAHNNDWLVKDLAYVGRVHDALDLAKNLIEIPRRGPGKEQAWRMGSERVIELLTRFELWDQLLALEGTIYLEPRPKPGEEANRLRALGVAAFTKGDAGKGEEVLRALTALLEKTRQDRMKAIDLAEAGAKKQKKTEDQIAKALANAMRGFSPQIDALNKAVANVRLARALHQGELEEAKRQFEAVNDLSATVQSQIHYLLGDHEKAEAVARDVARVESPQVLPLAHLAELLWRRGKKNAALEAFQQLRAVSAPLDIDVPAFARLAPLARELKLPADWRAQASVAPDAGERPDLATLGPIRWRPYEAALWRLPDQNGVELSLADYHGKPVIVVFYLGSGCAHCIEQLNLFGPMSARFAATGIELVAVSTDSADGLQQTFEKAADGKGFPFPIVADPASDVFKSHGAFDDFENLALHGTFLIDEAGFVRWQNISYQPFRDVEWLLGEATRLLKVPVTWNDATTAAVETIP
ncbi:MAG: peroxiredoxin family protein [Verrucomicrobiota bacterium]|nr:peroxiredoxin family protein [Verrucomicrobiota bacterium]